MNQFPYQFKYMPTIPAALLEGVLHRLEILARREGATPADLIRRIAEDHVARSQPFEPRTLNVSLPLIPVSKTAPSSPSRAAMWTSFSRMIISLPDVNIWIALAAESHVHHVPARDWFTTQQDTYLAFCHVTQMGLLRLLTNSNVKHQSHLDTLVCSVKASVFLDSMRRFAQAIFW
jgi:hypothetical protein